MVTVNVDEAKTQKTQLSTLLVWVEKGEEVVIVRSGAPYAKLALCEPLVKRQPGAWKGLVTVGDEFFEPLPEEELAAWEGR